MFLKMSFKPSPIQCNPWMDPIHEKLWSKRRCKVSRSTEKVEKHCATHWHRNWRPLTDEIPLSVGFVQRVVADELLRRYTDVQLPALVCLRLELDFAVLIVERKPTNAHRTVRHRQLELAVPDARPVGQHLHPVFVATRFLLLRAERTQCSKFLHVSTAGRFLFVRLQVWRDL